MKLIIEIPEEAYNRLLTEQHLPNRLDIEWCIVHGTPISDNATNGDVIKDMFPNTEIMITDERVFLRDGTIVMIYPLTWWNAPYQKAR
jgi:hypothetical protein